MYVGCLSRRVLKFVRCVNIIYDSIANRFKKRRKKMKQPANL